MKEEKVDPTGLATLDWPSQAPEHVEGEGNIAEDKKFEPSGLATYVLTLPSPRACQRGGSEEQTKTRRSHKKLSLSLRVVAEEVVVTLSRRRSGRRCELLPS
jgi:hypothetical protein